MRLAMYKQVWVFDRRALNLDDRNTAMKRRDFLTHAATLPFYLRTVFAKQITTPSGKSRSALPAGTPILSRYQLTRDRVIRGKAPAYSVDFILEDIYGEPGRRFTEFSGDVSGRWIGALSTAALVYGDHFETLDEVVQKVISLQHPEGYFGKTFHYDKPNDLDLALLWGNGRLLIGLIEYYRLTRKTEVLGAARRLGDFLIRLGPEYNSSKMADEFSAAHFASSYICWTQLTEGLAALYVETQDPRYRDLCSAIAGRMERRPGDHVHGYLTSLRGTLDLFEVTRDTAHLKLVEARYDEILDSGDILVTGGVPEAWSPKKKRTEGCAECDWLRLNLHLYKITGDERYIDMAERIIFNEFSMNQFATGDFGHAVLDSNGVPQMLTVRAWWCCTLHGMRAFADVTRSVFRLDGKTATFALPLDGVLTTADLILESTSSVASNRTATLYVRRANGHSLKIRRPLWARNIAVHHNGRLVPEDAIELLKTGDRVHIAYSMEPTTTSWKGVGNIVQYGPWLLGAASTLNPGYFNELHASNKLIRDSLISSPEDANSPFHVPIASMQARVTPAEYPEQSQNVVLRAIAEQTTIPSTQWQIVFS